MNNVRLLCPADTEGTVVKLLLGQAVESLNPTLALFRGAMYLRGAPSEQSASLPRLIAVSTSTTRTYCENIRRSSYFKPHLRQPATLAYNVPAPVKDFASWGRFFLMYGASDSPEEAIFGSIFWGTR